MNIKTTKNKKRNNKSRSWLALTAHPVNIILSVSQLAAWLEVSFSFFPFWFLCISAYFCFYSKVWSSGTRMCPKFIPLLQLRRFNYIYIWIVNSTFGCLVELPSRLANLTKEGLQTKSEDDVKCLPSMQPKATGNKNRDRPKAQIWRQMSMLSIIPTILPHWFRS